MRTFILQIFLLTAVTIFAAELPDTDSPDVLDMTVSENIATPAVPKKAENYIRTAMDQLRRNLVKQGFNVTSIRSGEVLKITIPCEQMFAPSSVELKPSSVPILRRLSSIVKDPLRYKVLVAVHTDDTGDEQYADSISASRANAIDDALWQIAGEKETNVIPYGIGKDEPLGPNTSRKNRSANRRVEIFIIPDRGMLEMAGVKNNK